MIRTQDFQTCPANPSDGRGIAWVARGITEVLAILLVATNVSNAKPFTVADEIELAHFGDPYGAESEAVQFSPDRAYFAALIERGRIDWDRPEDTVRIYRTQEVLGFLRSSQDVPAPTPAPFWSFSRSTDKDGPLITHWRWLADSSGIAFLERGAHGSNRLVLADLKKQTIEPLTPSGSNIKAFDIRDRYHYVYAAEDKGLLDKAATERKAVAVVWTGRRLTDLLFPVDENPYRALETDRSELWAVAGGKPFRVKDRASGKALVLFGEGQRSLALSPDGQSAITALAVPEVPAAWEHLFQPPYASYPFRLRAGTQDLTTFDGDFLVNRYVHIELRSGVVRSLSDGPVATATGWATGASPVWSQDGNTIVLPDAFVASDASSARACIAVVSLSTLSPSCVEVIRGPSETGSFEQSRWIEAVQFDGQDKSKIRVSYYENGTDRHGNTVYQQTTLGNWEATPTTTGSVQSGRSALEVTVNQDVNNPPVLAATDSTTKVSRPIWDPNPQLAEIELGKATGYRWKDKGGRDRKGVLYKPASYEPGHRYPLVIQTHGSSVNEFRPSGLFPTAFAARALADAGIAVLQADMCPIFSSEDEGPCNVDGYEAAVTKLVKEGLVDPEQVGIIGFSRTCFHVMEALTTSALHFKAASITDGVMGGYFQYLLGADEADNVLAKDSDAMIGARPFGGGLQKWLNRSPLFNLDKASAPLLVVAGEGRSNMLFMWEPYALMRFLHKPVDLIVLNNNEHVLSNPAARLASQGGSVDWFRFWLQNYEDPNPAKAEQYRRWRELRKLQEAQDAERSATSGKDVANAP